MTSFGKKIYCFFYLLEVLCPTQENITVYKVSSKNCDLDFDRPKRNWINQVLDCSKFVSILLCIFVTEWSRIDQDDQSDLVFSFGLDYCS